MTAGNEWNESNGVNEVESEKLDTVQSMSFRRPAVARLARRAGLLAGLGALVAGCANNAPQDTFDPAGPNARSIDNLQRPIFWLAGAIGLLVFAAVGFIVWRFRDRGQPIPEQSHGKPILEIAPVILSAALLAGISVPTIAVLNKLAKTSDTTCVVAVTGQQWWWEYAYPVQDGCLPGGIKTPIITSGELVLPVKTKVLLQIQSNDVIHSFWIPRLNGKRDAVPGRTHPLRMEADEPGIYTGQCTEFCGLSHARMRMAVAALNEADFATWVGRQQAEYVKPTDPLAVKGEGTFQAQCSRCHQVNGLTTPDGKPVISQPELYVVSGNAPNLTHLMSRTSFAGATWDLINESCRTRLWKAPPAEFGALYLKGVDKECFNEKDLREWIKNAPAKKPMYASPGQAAKTGGLTRGMPNLNLNDEQVSEIIAYLLERK